jgi:hypothetical protein
VDIEMNEAKVVGVWLIVECPECHVPSVYKKFVTANKVFNLMAKRHMTCEVCNASYFVTLEEMETELH